MKVEIKGLDSVIKKVESMTNMPEKANKIFYKLCEIGEQEVRKAHRDVEYDYNFDTNSQVAIQSDIRTYIDVVDNKTSLVAEGQQLLFHEFGAGISKNNPREWSNVLNIPVPLTILPIGTYGQGFGMNEKWVYREANMAFLTKGYKAKAGFAHAINAIVANTDRIIKEVLNE